MPSAAKLALGEEVGNAPAVKRERLISSRPCDFGNFSAPTRFAGGDHVESLKKKVTEPDCPCCRPGSDQRAALSLSRARSVSPGDQQNGSTSNAP